MEQFKIINGYKIYKSGTWCEVTKNGDKIYNGNVEESMTPEQIYREVTKEVVFSLRGKELMSYDYISEFAGERENTIKLLAQENKCSKKDIEIKIRQQKIKNERTR